MCSTLAGVGVTSYGISLDSSKKEIMEVGGPWAPFSRSGLERPFSPFTASGRTSVRCQKPLSDVAPQPLSGHFCAAPVPLDMYPQTLSRHFCACQPTDSLAAHLAHSPARPIKLALNELHSWPTNPLPFVTKRWQTQSAPNLPTRFPNFTSHAKILKFTNLLGSPPLSGPRVSLHLVCGRPQVSPYFYLTPARLSFDLRTWSRVHEQAGSKHKKRGRLSPVMGVCGQVITDFFLSQRGAGPRSSALDISSTVGHCRSEESEAQAQEPQQSKGCKKLRASTQARSRRGSLEARRNLEQDKLFQKACKAKEIVRSTAKAPTSRNPPLFLLTV